MHKIGWNNLLGVAGLLALVAWFAPAHALDPQVVGRIDEPFEVDGQVYPAGQLSIREISSYGPVATLNEFRVNGQSIGMLLALDSERPSTADHDQLIFARGPAGHLVLVSIALRGEHERTLTSLRESTITVTASLLRDPLAHAAR